MAGRPFQPPIERDPDHHDRWVVRLDKDERALLVRLLGELRMLLTGVDDETGGPDDLIVARLFPAVYDDAAHEAEYQRLMRDELVASRVAAIDAISAVLAPRKVQPLDEARTVAFMQSINAVRLVLGTMLGITDDATAAAADDAETAEHGLYHFLGWLLEWTVRALQTD